VPARVRENVPARHIFECVTYFESVSMDIYVKMCHGHMRRDVQRLKYCAQHMEHVPGTCAEHMFQAHVPGSLTSAHHVTSHVPVGTSWHMCPWAHIRNTSHIRICDVRAHVPKHVPGTFNLWNMQKYENTKLFPIKFSVETTTS
jgi:hypothetical protein